MDRYFPIKTATACQLKWTWSTIRLYPGTTSSCHRVQTQPIDVGTFDSFHNTEKQIQDRELMLRGEWPSGGCEYCKKIEDAGGQSDRLFQLQIPNLVPPELDDDLNATAVTPRILEVYFDNVCNMSCVYCWDGFSSKIQQENHKFGRFDRGGVVIENRTKKVPYFEELSDKFWQYMKKNGSTLRRLHVLGGEPFYQKQFDRCLEFFESNPCPELEFNVVSNLMIDQEKLIKHIDRIRKLLINRRIARFDLTASIDCFGKEQEYVRYGLDMDLWRKNFTWLTKQRWIKLNINQVISGLTIKTSAELLEFVARLRSERPIGHFFSTPVHTYDFFHPKIFGKKFFDKDFEKILSQMPRDSWEQKQMYEYMEGLQIEMNIHSRDQEKINQLVIFLDEIDRRRGLDWRHTFPWLAKEVD